MDQNLRPSTPIARVVLASFIGTSIEWYDFFLYGTAAALVFNKLFFPTLDPLAGTMASFATYAVGFFARPLGGIIFGHYGDKIKRNVFRVLKKGSQGGMFHSAVWVFQRFPNRSRGSGRAGKPGECSHCLESCDRIRRHCKLLDLASGTSGSGQPD